MLKKFYIINLHLKKLHENMKKKNEQKNILALLEVARKHLKTRTEIVKCFKW